MRKESNITTKNQQNIKKGRKRKRTNTRHTQSIKPSGNKKSFPISNCSKCKWIKLINQKKIE
jgi:hypothetical protein